MEVIIVITMKMQTDEEELLLDISKKNSILVLNKETFLRFYNNFYQVLENKNKKIEIFLENKLLDSKNSFLLTLTDQTELLESLNFKKGTLFYDYILNKINADITLDREILFYDLVNFLKNIQENSEVNVDFDINEDFEKLVLSMVDFHLNYDFKKIDEIINILLKNYIERNPNKTGIIFYDSSFVTFDINSYDSCYFFDVNIQKKLKDYNLLFNETLNEFNLDFIINKLEAIWPIEFNKEEVLFYLELYFKSTLVHFELEVFNESSLLAYELLNRLYGFSLKFVKRNFQIRDNVKSFLEQL